MVVLPLTYLGNLAWFARLCFGQAIIDVGEHYVKQSYRNRCDILLSNGVSALSVPVVAGPNFPKQAVNEVRIDYSRRWQHTHWMSIRSGYGSAPYWETYEGMLAPLFEQRFERLCEWNRALLEVVLKALGSDVTPVFSEQYVTLQQTWEDLRQGLSPKPRLHRPDGRFRAELYWQPFSDRQPFAANLSIVDLLFCQGPGALAHLRRCVV